MLWSLEDLCIAKYAVCAHFQIPCPLSFDVAGGPSNSKICRMSFPPSNLNIPQGRVAWPDDTVPRKDVLYNMYWEPDVAEHQPPRPQGYRDQYPDHTRVVHHQSKSMIVIRETPLMFTSDLCYDL